MLRDFLRGCADKRCVLGQHDCGLFLADWIKAVTGNDPAAAVRGRYASDDELAALAGPLGLPRLFDRLLTAGGLSRTKEPTLGDVAIVTLAGSSPRGAIRSAAGFVLVAPQGISRAAVDTVRIVMAWSL